jgi:iron complex outermembrane receptor protein
MRLARCHRLALRWLAALCISAGLSARAEELAQTFDFAIAPQPLATALTQFSKLTGIQVVAGAYELGAVRTAGVEGRLAAADALARLLRGTAFTTQAVGDRTVVVVMRQPAADAATRAGTAGDSRERDASRLETVVVTGSRRKRSAGDSTAPIDVIEGRELQRLGAVTLTDALNELLPSFNYPAVAGQDQSTIVRPASLRGMSADQMLVLVNGKRRHAGAVVNSNSQINKGSEPVFLNLIPVAAVERIEVLRDGAAAQYGSDAIAGVINVVLRSDTGEGRFSAKFGGYDFKDGFSHQETLDKGFAYGETGYLHLAAEYLDQRHTDRSFATLPQNPTGPDGALAYYWGRDYAGGQPARFDPRESSAAGQHRVQDGIPDVHGVNLSYNAGLASDALELYSFSTYSYRVGTGYENFRYANGNADPTFCPDGSGGAANPYCQIDPDGYEPREIITQNDFSTTLGIKGQDLYGWSWDLSSTYGKDDARVGVDSSLNATLGPDSPTRFYNGSWIATELTNDLDLSRAFALGLAAPLNLALGLEHRNTSYTVKPGQNESWWYGPDNLCAADPQASAYCGFTAPDGSIRMPGAGAQSYNGFEPRQSGHDYRDSFAGYIDVETRPWPRWDLGIAARFEHYDDFGNTRTGKLSMRYQLLKVLALRGTLSNGFRAPTLGQSLYGSSSTFFSNGQALDILTAPVGSDVAKALGASALKPEKSTNQSLGLVFTPLRNLDITLDLYRIYVRHRLSVSGYLGPDYQYGPCVKQSDGSILNADGSCVSDASLRPTIDDLFPSGTRPLDLQYFGNLVDTRTQGADLVLDYRCQFGRYGRVRWSLEANVNQNALTGIAPNPALFARRQADGNSVESVNPGFVNVFDAAQQGYLTAASPHNKLILGADWRREAVAARLSLTRFGKVLDTTYPEAVQSLTPKIIVDLDLSWELRSGLSLGLGADNLLDTYPPKTTPAYRARSGPFGFGQYDSFAPYGYFGGFYYARFGLRF